MSEWHRFCEGSMDKCKSRLIYEKLFKKKKKKNTLSAAVVVGSLRVKCTFKNITQMSSIHEIWMERQSVLLFPSNSMALRLMVKQTVQHILVTD